MAIIKGDRGGQKDDLIFDTSQNDTIYGFRGDDTLYGGRRGDDIVYGGAGNDVIILSIHSDTAYGGEGDDRIVTWLFSTDKDNISFGGNGNDILDGGNNADMMNGDGGYDTLSGRKGNDNLYGGAQSDRLFGGLGADKLNGGAGADILYGGPDKSADQFVFITATDSRMAARDIIYDFTLGSDKINLVTIDANTKLAGNQAFTFNGTTAKAGAVWYKDIGANIIVYADVNRDNVADFAVEVANINNLKATDFIL